MLKLQHFINFQKIQKKQIDNDSGVVYYRVTTNKGEHKMLNANIAAREYFGYYAGLYYYPANLTYQN